MNVFCHCDLQQTCCASAVYTVTILYIQYILNVTIRSDACDRLISAAG